MRPVQLSDFRSAYVDLVRYVLETGDECEPRGYKTREVRGATFTLTDTRRALPYGVGRDLRPEIGYAEALLLCGGLASPSLLTSVSGAFRMFLDGGAHHGAYGPRARPQLDGVVEALRRDPDSRQAVVEIYDPRYDQQPVRDVPCTLGFQFMLRGGGLHMFSTMRSQDVWLGAAYDVFMFCQLGHTVANALGVRLETLTHQARSLHLYERNFDAARHLRTVLESETDGTANTITEPAGIGQHQGHAGYEDARLRAESIYLRAHDRAYTGSELDYCLKLDSFDRLTPRDNFAS